MDAALGHSSVESDWGTTILVAGMGRIACRPCFRYDRIYPHPLHKKDQGCSGAYAIADDLDADTQKIDIRWVHYPESPEAVGSFDATWLDLVKNEKSFSTHPSKGSWTSMRFIAISPPGYLADARLGAFKHTPQPPDSQILRSETAILSRSKAVAMAVVAAHNILRRLDGALNRRNTIKPEVHG